MTREEAIEKLELMRQKVDEETYRALILAIKALSQEPCDDVVSRQAVINAIENDCMKGGLGSCFACYNDAQAFRGEIEKLPSVTQKSGKWVKVKSGDKDFPESIVCSRCNNENSHLDFNENAEPIGKVFVTSKYCPNCGAKMVEPQESEDN